MRNQLIMPAIATSLLVVAGSAFADHNSKNGEGWANMPNDIHNTRVETRENDDNEAFRDFVKYGEGSRTENRFDSDDTQPGQATEKKGNTRTAANQGESKPMKKDQASAQTTTKGQARSENRSRLESGVSGASRMNRSGMSMRGNVSRRGRGRR